MGALAHLYSNQSKATSQALYKPWIMMSYDKQNLQRYRIRPSKGSQRKRPEPHTLQLRILDFRIVEIEVRDFYFEITPVAERRDCTTTPTLYLALRH